MKEEELFDWLSSFLIEELIHAAQYELENQLDNTISTSNAQEEFEAKAIIGIIQDQIFDIEIITGIDEIAHEFGFLYTTKPLTL